MNCDQAFDALTDLNQRDSKPLKTHLDNCPRCAEMRQILEPALDLFAPLAESEYLDQASALGNDFVRRPEEMFYLSPEAVQVAQQTAIDLAKQQPISKQPSSVVLVVMKQAAVFLIGAVVMWGALSLQSNSRSADKAIPTMPVSHCLWKNRTASQLISESTDKTQRKLTADVVTMSCIACHQPNTTQNGAKLPSSGQFSIPVNPPGLLIQQL